jgi:AcrR family transcriptional regulator
MEGRKRIQKASPPPRRRPATGGYARGDEKRVKIVEAAIRRFAKDGYEGASTRQIAKEAGVNPPALQYYFDGKAGLYAACHQHIADGMAAIMQAPYARAAKVRSNDPEEAVDVFCALLEAVAKFVFEMVEIQDWRQFEARVRAGEGNSLIDEAVKTSIEQEFLKHCFRLVAIATGVSSATETVKLKTFAAMSMLTAFHLELERMLARLNWPDLRGPRLVKFKAILMQQARAVLTT